MAALDGDGARPPETGDTLACGASVDELLEQVAQGRGGERTDHERRCPHCQASLAELSRLWAPVRAYAAVALPVPPSLVSGVMRDVRRLVRDTWYTLDLTEGGSIRVAARVVAVLARDAARRVPGVRVALGRSTASRISKLVEKATFGHQHPHAAVGVLGKTAVVELALAVDYGPPVHEVAAQVQQEVLAELRRSVGLRSIAVNVTVDDVALPASGVSVQR